MSKIISWRFHHSELIKKTVTFHSKWPWQISSQGSDLLESFDYHDQINMNTNHCLKNQFWSLQEWPLSVYLHSREQLRYAQLLDCRSLLSTFEKLINHCLVPAHHHRWIRLPAPCEAFYGSEEQHKNLCQTFLFSFSSYRHMSPTLGAKRLTTSAHP